MQQIDAQAQISKLISGFFAAFDNRNGLAADLSTLLGYFAENAVIARASRSEIQLVTAREFAVPRIELLESGALVNFYEAETTGTTSIFGRIAHHTSRYRKSGVLHGNAYSGAGTKSFQLVALETGWRILSLAWIDDEA